MEEARSLRVHTPVQDYYLQGASIKYNHLNYSKFTDFLQHILNNKKEQFQVLITEGQPLGRTVLPASLGAPDTAAQSIATAVVMRHASWLHLSGFPKEVQTTLEDSPFGGPKLFTELTDESLHSLKNSRQHYAPSAFIHQNKDKVDVKLLLVLVLHFLAPNDTTTHNGDARDPPPKHKQGPAQSTALHPSTSKQQF